MDIELKIVRHDRMFSFVNGYKEVIQGCDFNCSYCWARAKEKDPRLTTPTFHPHSLRIPPKPNTVVFLNSRSDTFCKGVKREWVKQIWDYTNKYPDTIFLSMTKNPFEYLCWREHISDNVILGATIETNRDTTKFSRAPVPLERFIDMNAINWPNKFISVEPVMDFDPQTFTRWILEIKPRWVAIGYDNYHNHLPEPHRYNVESLIMELETQGITVFRKTMREKNYEVS
jgi:hypothetical protein